MMKISSEKLRQIINEEYLRGLPEFVLRQATTKYVEEIRQHLKKYILENRSTTGARQREAFVAVDEVLKELETKANDLLEDALFQFTRQV